MKNTLLGILVLALVAGGVYWTRVVHAPQATPATSAAEGAPTSSDAHRMATAASDAMLPDITTGEASVNAGDVRITLSVEPRPPVAFQTNRFRVRAESANGPVVLENGRIYFEMTMPMGDHRYELVPGADGSQEADVVLPMCGSGNPRWYATVEGTVAGEPRRVRFKLDLAKSGTVPVS